MKPSLYLLIPALFLVSCDQREVDASRLVTRSDTVYEINSDTPFTGVSLAYHENGQVEVRITFQDGKQNGLLERYHDNGQLALTRLYFKDGVGPDGIIEYYREDGSLFSRRNYTNGNLNGISEELDEDGTVTYRSNYKDGIPVGRCFGAGCTDFN